MSFFSIKKVKISQFLGSAIIHRNVRATDTDSLPGCDLPKELAVEVHWGTLVSLGLTLIELCIGKTSTAMRKDRYDRPIEAIMLLTTARRRLDDVYRHEDHSYATVAEKLLICEGVHFDLTETCDFRELVLSNILKPLIDNLDYIDGRNVHDEWRTLSNWTSPWPQQHSARPTYAVYSCKDLEIGWPGAKAILSEKFRLGSTSFYDIGALFAMPSTRPCRFACRTHLANAF